MCEGEGCEGCECEGCACEGCECSNGFLYACLCCYAVEPVAEVRSDVKQEKKKRDEGAPTPPLVMLRSGQDGYQVV